MDREYRTITSQTGSAKTDNTNRFPVSVYDTVEKKLVMICVDNVVCDLYVFDKLQYQSNRTRYLTNEKGKTSKNVFGISLAFRFANNEQKKILSSHQIVILDKRFIRESKVRVKDESANEMTKSVSL